MWLKDAHPKINQLLISKSSSSPPWPPLNPSYWTYRFTTLSTISHRTADSTFHGIWNARIEPKSNAASIFTPLGGGIHSHLDLEMTTGKYTSTTSTADFVVPVNPATTPIYTSTTTPVQISKSIPITAKTAGFSDCTTMWTKPCLTKSLQTTRSPSYRSCRIPYWDSYKSPACKWSRTCAIPTAI